MEPYLLEPMKAPYEDWSGTAAAENSAVNTSGDLYELAGLDRSEWQILGVEIDTFSHGEPSDWTVRVFAFNRRENGVSGYEDLKALEAREGSVPVTDVLLHGVTLEDVVRCMKYIGFRIELKNFRRLRVVEKSDFPVQE